MCLIAHMFDKTDVRSEDGWSIGNLKSQWEIETQSIYLKLLAYSIKWNPIQQLFYKPYCWDLSCSVLVTLHQRAAD